MTNRNELERLLAAASGGPWYVSAYYSGTGPDERCSGMIVSGDDLATGIIDENEAPCGDSLSHDLDLICFLRNNVPHYLSLMDEVERLREALGRIASCDLLEVERYYERTWCIPETGNEYTSREPVFKRSSYQNAEEFQAIARQALGETHDN